MDRKRKPLDDLKVRKAIAHSINRDALVQFIGPDVASPLYSVIPPSFVGALQDVPAELRYDFNPEKAKQLLADAGLPKGFNLNPVFISEKPMFRRAFEVLQNQLAQVGIGVNLNVIAPSRLAQEERRGKQPPGAGGRPHASPPRTSSWRSSSSRAPKGTSRISTGRTRTSSRPRRRWTRGSRRNCGATPRPRS